MALLHDVGVAPAPAHGGASAGNECHTTSKKNTVIIAFLAKYNVSRVALEAYTKAWRLWNRIRPALNTASILPHADIVAFAADTNELMATLATFERVSVSAKMHMLHRHASPFMAQCG